MRQVVALFNADGVQRSAVLETVLPRQTSTSVQSKDFELLSLTKRADLDQTGASVDSEGAQGLARTEHVHLFETFTAVDGEGVERSIVIEPFHLRQTGEGGAHVNDGTSARRLVRHERGAFDVGSECI